MNDQPINYAYLSGHLEQAFKNLPRTLAREGIIELHTVTFMKIQQLIEKEIKRSTEAEREYVVGMERRK
jgi:hypothetical protein